ncbi:hypothetical protein OIC43_37090 [Streptomyces sp. NBC_00825]|uniref:hypothetical protein n=1 Tax=unclassified Streptomyces TaxID=2593676 RepID=UPI002ED28E8C|nr:hypothetical protein OG832_06600 [Streptomyces sp. NBC_00826]WTH94253.1 hypothetical protein OIC43_37090 [Streptomyces sp. NBC_00825]WTI02988.1 hypothetical protein OHA23_37070 [Streptomyces sp. NBC_00822]
MALTELEIKILHQVPMSGALQARAYAVWTGRNGEVEMGPVRARRVEIDGSCSYECSPFPGAWDRDVPQSRIQRVRHLQAMSLQGADVR